MPGPGLVEATITALLDWAGGTGLPARPGPPSATPSDQAGVRVWLFALLPEQELRPGNGFEPLRLRMRFLLTTERADDVAALDTLLSASVHGPFAAVFEAVDAEIWHLLGVPPRPAFFTDVVGHLDRPAPVRPRVASPLRVVMSPTVHKGASQ